MAVLLAAAVARGQGGRDPAAVLEQARARLQAMARNLEKYVCVETLDRSSYRPAASQRLVSTDRVRLEVSLAQGRELHSWPGATRFDARNVDALIGNGPVSTGAFGGYLASVFGQPGVTFEYAGEQTANGRRVFEYRYRVPVEASRFEIKSATAWRAAAYEGSFQVDPESFELSRLTVRTGELPADAGFCKASTTLEYERVHIGDSDVVLPRQSQLDIVLDEEREARNVTTFSKCREYQAESAISFDAPTGRGWRCRSGCRSYSH